MARDVLLVKLSSLGDVVHGFAVLGDLRRFAGGVQVCWAAEEAFVSLVEAHPMVSRTVSVPMRRLRREKPWHWLFCAEMRAVYRALRRERFEFALDLQGLIKSGWLLRRARAGVYAGYDNASAREGLAALFYDKTVPVARDLHAVERMRRLAGAVFGYVPEGRPDYGLPLWQENGSREVLFFHGTTWASKLLPEAVWLELIALAQGEGFRVLLPWGNDEERERAVRLASAGASVLPRLSLPELQARLYASAGVISVDTGLGHLAAACGVPVLGVFGPTNADLSGMYGLRSVNLAQEHACMCRDCRQHGAESAQGCMSRWSAAEIWDRFLLLKRLV